MWTEITRPQYLRNELHYARDVNEAEWNVISHTYRPPSCWGRARWS
jgi:hypothetical protein